MADHQQPDACSSVLCSGCLDLFSISDSNKEEASPPSKKIKEDESLNDDAAVVNTVCQHCFGTLDLNFQEHVVQEICQVLEIKNYVGLRYFRLCIQVTPSLIMQHGIVTKWLQQMGKVSDTIISGMNGREGVKEILKDNVIDLLAAKLNIRPNADCLFDILVHLEHNDADTACHMLVSSKEYIKKKHSRRRNRNTNEPSHPRMTIANVQKAIDETSYDELQQRCLLPTQTAYTSKFSVSVSMIHDSIYVAGRYNKFSRTLSQTPWILDGVRIAETSIQDLMNDQLIKKIKYDFLRLSSSGREDVDVRMLGPGRPFLLELVNPKVVNLTDNDYKTIEMEINTNNPKDIFVTGLCEVNSDSQKVLKDGEENKKKTYSALIYSSTPITEQQIKFLDDIRKLTISQTTPLRVLHRRSLAVRERVIHSMVATYIDSNHFKLVLVTGAGTYIKEFVHSDFGRTVPNLCCLMGIEVDIRALDVIDLDMNWPPTKSTKPLSNS